MRLYPLASQLLPEQLDRADKVHNGRVPFSRGGTLLCLITRYQKHRSIGATVLSGVFVYIQALTEGVFTDPAGLPLGTATHFHSVAIATQPVHRLQIRPVVHN